MDFQAENSAASSPNRPPQREEREEKMLSQFHAWWNFLLVQTGKPDCDQWRKPSGKKVRVAGEERTFAGASIKQDSHARRSTVGPRPWFSSSRFPKGGSAFNSSLLY